MIQPSSEVPSEWFDVTVPIYDQMVHWPDNPPVHLSPFLDMARGDPANVSLLSLGLHTGTHMDAPVHFIPGTIGIDALPLDVLLGTARVLGIPEGNAVVTARELEPHSIAEGERILLKTSNSRRCWSTDKFVPDYVYLSADGARHLVERGARTVGIDYLSIGGGSDGVETHRSLLSAGIAIIEGLDLSQVVPGRYDLLCLPLKIRGGDGAPARVLLRKA